MDGLAMRFRTVKLRERSKDCEVCKEGSQFDLQNFDYNGWCKKMCDIFAVLQLDKRVIDLQPQQLKDLAPEIQAGQHLFLDVRPSHHFIIVKLPDSDNIDYDVLIAKKDDELLELFKGKDKIIILCRLGNNSRLACNNFIERFP